MKLGLLPALSSVSLGLLIGLGGTTFNYAEGLSYLSTEPAACVNCHIMQPEYDAWQKASHHTAATCVDCHLPPELPGKYIAKAENGWNHSKAFTLQGFPEPIVITKKNAEILHANCVRCHADLIRDQAIVSTEGAPRCVHCHVSVGHGEPVGLGGPMKALVSVRDSNKSAVNSPVKPSAPEEPARMVLAVPDGCRWKRTKPSGRESAKLYVSSGGTRGPKDPSTPAQGRKPVLRNELAAVVTVHR